MNKSLHNTHYQTLNKDMPGAGKKVFTVSELSRKIKRLLEAEFPFFWITGEISNFTVPASGHFYFTLKDRDSQVQAVMFRGQNRTLKFLPENGMQITGLGRLTLYEPRGTYQVIFEYLEPKGYGDLQAAFEQLKKRLSDEGLFDESRKKPIPFLPDSICLITSASGAVVHDMLRIISSRYPNTCIKILPVSVQGNEAEKEICDALESINSNHLCSVCILARGGGSLEDLAAFNSESVARSVFKSKIPVISAVGHETDYTISDFVADVRAPTPSAAAEMVVPNRFELEAYLKDLDKRLKDSLIRIIQRHEDLLSACIKRLKDPKRQVYDFRLKVEDYTTRTNRSMQKLILSKKERLYWNINRLGQYLEGAGFKIFRLKIEESRRRLREAVIRELEYKRRNYEKTVTMLKILNPEAILEKGYTITRKRSDRSIVRNAASIFSGDELELIFFKGKAEAVVTKIDPTRKVYKDGTENI